MRMQDLKNSFRYLEQKKEAEELANKIIIQFEKNPALIAEGDLRFIIMIKCKKDDIPYAPEEMEKLKKILDRILEQEKEKKQMDITQLEKQIEKAIKTRVPHGVF